MVGQGGGGESGPGPEGRSARAVTVIVVEDVDVVRRRLVEMLERSEGVSVVATGRTGEEALAETRDHEPDVLLLDLGLPGPSGLDVIRHLRKQGFEGSIIILTNQADPATRARSLRAGADAFFDKSEEFERALDAVRELAAARRLDRELDGET